MEKKEIIKSLVLLQEKMLKMREEGEADLRGLISEVEHIIMCIEA